MRSPCLMVFAVLAFTASHLCADENLTRVLAAPDHPDDIRQRQTFDVDHPANFDPHFKTAALWEKRAEILREQMKVALGLWPMPPTYAAEPGHSRQDRIATNTRSRKSTSAAIRGHYVSGNLYRPKGHDWPAAGSALPARPLGQRPFHRQ